mgnify:CR=1 FL=1
MFWSDLVGTTLSFLRLGFAGPRLKDSAGHLVVRNAADTADAAITASAVNVSGDVLVLNSDATQAAADWTMTLQRDAANMTGNVTLTLPPTDGTSGQVLQTDGNGVMTWVDAGSTTLALKVNTTSLTFGDSSPIAVMTLPANNIISAIDVIVDTAFDGTPSASVGITGTPSKYLSATALDLTGAARYSVHPDMAAPVANEPVIITYAAGGATQGSARVLIYYAEPAA